MTEKIITDKLGSFFFGNCRWFLTNAYIFKHDWESDFFVQKVNGYCYEFEVKISRSDFFHDKKKVDKMEILKTGSFNHVDKEYIGYDKEQKKSLWKERQSRQEHKRRPNRFYYIVPEGMITVDELPEFAGLYTFSPYGNLQKIKEAPMLHKEVLNLDSILATKFYFNWRNAESKLKRL